jgi:hypothetical protein
MVEQLGRRRGKINRFSQPRSFRYPQGFVDGHLLKYGPLFPTICMMWRDSSR